MVGLHKFPESTVTAMNSCCVPAIGTTGSSAEWVVTVGQGQCGWSISTKKGFLGMSWPLHPHFGAPSKALCLYFDE